MEYWKEKLKVEIELLKWSSSIFLLLTIGVITLVRTWGESTYNQLNKPSDQILFVVGLILDFCFVVYLIVKLKAIEYTLEKIKQRDKE